MCVSIKCEMGAAAGVYRSVTCSNTNMYGLDPRDARSKNCTVTNVIKPERQLVALREWVKARVIES